jgi:prepilin-type N-terminal cleavage/methylation domain-containing protein/prepilin-type processing-associated H-X9-DG protein
MLPELNNTYTNRVLRLSSGRPGTPRAFTLVELLVVIGIIALLISILLPALNKARDSAKTVACLSNLRQVGVSLMLYASEHRGYSPPGSASTGNGFENWVTYLLASKATTQQIDRYANAAEESAKLSTWTSANHGIFRCPSDSNTAFEVIDWNGNARQINGTLWGSPTADPYSAAGAWIWRVNSRQQLQAIVDTSYGINGGYGFLIGWTSHEQYFFKNHVYWNYPGGTRDLRLRKLNDVRQPARFAMIYDGFYLLDGQVGRVNARHGNRRLTNVLCADGHAESVDRKEIPIGSFSLANLANYPSFRWRLDQP